MDTMIVNICSLDIQFHKTNTVCQKSQIRTNTTIVSDFNSVLSSTDSSSKLKKNPQRNIHVKIYDRLNEPTANL